MPAESVYRYDLGPVLDLLRIPLDGGRYLHWLTVQDGQAGVVIVVTDGAVILLQRQWRAAVVEFVWQFPRGFGEPVADGGIPDAVADAARELREETGIDGAALTELGRILPDPGILSAEVVVVEARVEAVDAAALRPEDPDEVIDEFALVPLAEVDGWIADGRLVDGITLAALQLWRARH